MSKAALSTLIWGTFSTMPMSAMKYLFKRVSIYLHYRLTLSQRKPRVATNKPIRNGYLLHRQSTAQWAPVLAEAPPMHITSLRLSRHRYTMRHRFYERRWTFKIISISSVFTQNDKIINRAIELRCVLVAVSSVAHLGVDAIVVRPVVVSRYQLDSQSGHSYKHASCNQPWHEQGSGGRDEGKGIIIGR